MANDNYLRMNGFTETLKAISFCVYRVIIRESTTLIHERKPFHKLVIKTNDE